MKAKNISIQTITFDKHVSTGQIKRTQIYLRITIQQWIDKNRSIRESERERELEQMRMYRFAKIRVE